MATEINLLMGFIAGFGLAAYLFNEKAKQAINKLLGKAVAKAKSSKKPAVKPRSRKSKKAEPWAEH